MHGEEGGEGERERVAEQEDGRRPVPEEAGGGGGAPPSPGSLHGPAPVAEVRRIHVPPHQRQHQLSQARSPRSIAQRKAGGCEFRVPSRFFARF